MAKKRKATRAGKSEIRYAAMLYCEKKRNPEAIAKELERDIKTIYAWRDKYGWQDTRDLFETGPTELKKILLNEANRIARGEVRKDEDGNKIPGIDADSLSKVMKAYDYMNKRTSVEVVYDVLVMLDNFVADIDPKKAEEFTHYHKMFIQNLISEE
jgi:hypothetical protein